MAIITLTNCKMLLQITGSGSDDLINLLIPRVQNDIVNYCNNPFLTKLS